MSGQDDPAEWQQDHEERPVSMSVSPTSPQQGDKQYVDHLGRRHRGSPPRAQPGAAANAGQSQPGAAAAGEPSQTAEDEDGDGNYHVYWQVEGAETTDLGGEPHSDDGHTAASPPPPLPNHPPPTGEQSSPVETTGDAARLTDLTSLAAVDREGNLESEYEMASSKSASPVNDGGLSPRSGLSPDSQCSLERSPTPKSRSQVSFAPFNANAGVIETISNLALPPNGVRKSSLKLKSPEQTTKNSLFTLDQPSGRNLSNTISEEDVDSTMSPTPSCVSVSKLQRRQIASSMRVSRAPRKTRTSHKAQEERDEYFERLNNNRDVFHHDSLVMDMVSNASLDNGKVEGVHPGHRDKFRMHSMLGDACQAHSDRKEAARRSTNGYQGLTHSEAVSMHAVGVKRLDEVKTLCVSIEEKLLLTQTLIHDIDGNERALEKHSGVVGHLYLWLVQFRQKCHSGWRWIDELATRSGLWAAKIKAIEGRHGSSSGVFFRALKWVFIMTIFQAVIWASMVFIPFGVIYGWKADEILVPEHQAPDQFSANENFIGLFTGGGFLNTSWYFIGGYTLAHDDYGTGETEADQTVLINDTSFLVPGVKAVDHNYSLDVVYLLTTYVYIGVPLLFCLSALYGILRSVFSGVDDTAGPTGKDALARFQLGKIIFASWEYSITFPTSIAMNQVIHANAIRTVLTEEHYQSLLGKRNKYVLYSKRIVAELLILALIVGGSWAVFTVTIEYSKSTEQIEQLYPALLLTAINAIYPDLFYILGGFEDVHMGTLTFLTLLRASVMRVVIMYVFIYTLLQDRQLVMCWESAIGAGFYNLFVIATLSEFLSSALVDFSLLKIWEHITGEKLEDDGGGDDDAAVLQRRRTARKSVALAREYTSPRMSFAPGGQLDRRLSQVDATKDTGQSWQISTMDGGKRQASVLSTALAPHRKGTSLILKFMGPPSFNFKKHMIELVYQQTLLTFGMFFCPGLVFIALVRQVANMYLKSWSTMKYCKVSRRNIHFAVHGLEAWVWLVFVMGIMVAAIPLAYVMSVESLPCSGDDMPLVWQQKFFEVPAGFTAQASCPTDLSVLKCSQCNDHSRDLSTAGCWNGGEETYFNMSLAEVCALCPTGCGPFRNLRTPYSSLVVASYDWPTGYHEFTAFVETKLFTGLIFLGLLLGVLYIWAMAEGRNSKIARLRLELEVHQKLTNNMEGGVLNRATSVRSRGSRRSVARETRRASVAPGHPPRYQESGKDPASRQETPHVKHLSGGRLSTVTSV